jgi:hypothetical protein
MARIPSSLRPLRPNRSNRPRRPAFAVTLLGIGVVAGTVGAPGLAVAAEPLPETLQLTAMLRAARVECGSTAPSANVACRLVPVVDACRRGEAGACETLGRYNVARSLHDVERGAAVGTLLLRACRLDPSKCAELVPVAMANGADETLARALLEEGCTRSASVCVSAASMYRAGRAVPADPDAARRFSARTCVAVDRPVSCTAGDAVRR